MEKKQYLTLLSGHQCTPRSGEVHQFQSTPSGVVAAGCSARKRDLLGGENRRLNLFLCMNKHLQHKVSLLVNSSLPLNISTYAPSPNITLLCHYARLFQR